MADSKPNRDFFIRLSRVYVGWRIRIEQLVALEVPIRCWIIGCCSDARNRWLCRPAISARFRNAVRTGFCTTWVPKPSARTKLTNERDHVTEFLLDKLPILIVFGVLAALWLFLRNKATSINSIPDLDGRVGSGQPVLLRFYRNT